MLLGNDKLMRERGVSVEALAGRCRELARAARTPMYLALGDELAGLIAVADPIKADARAAVERLQRDGLRVIMLTGDNAATAAADGGRPLAAAAAMRLG